MSDRCPFENNFEMCIRKRRNCMPEQCTNCKVGKSREILISESREARCGRCDELLSNPEDSFCNPCRRLEYQEYPIQFIDYFEETEPKGARNVKHSTCPRGHKFIKENTFPGSRSERRCMVCKQTTQMIREERRKKK